MCIAPARDYHTVQATKPLSQALCASSHQTSHKARASENNNKKSLSAGGPCLVEALAPFLLRGKFGTAYNAAHSDLTEYTFDKSSKILKPIVLPLEARIC